MPGVANPGLLGSGGGGIDLTSMALLAQDLSDGTWSSWDDNGFIKASSVTDDLTRFVYNDVSPGSSNNAWSLGTTTNAARWYKALVDDNGDAIVGGDSFVVILEIDNSAGFVADCDCELFFGLVAAPTAVATAPLKSHGICEQHVSGGTPRYLAHTISGGGGALTNANNQSARAVFIYNRNQGSTVGAAAYGGGDGRGQSGDGDNNTYFADGAAIYLCIGAGIRTTGVAAEDDEATATFRCRVIKLSE